MSVTPYEGHKSAHLRARNSICSQIWPCPLYMPVFPRSYNCSTFFSTGPFQARFLISFSSLCPIFLAQYLPILVSHVRTRSRMAFASLIVGFGVVGLIAVVSQYVFAYLQSPLKKIPGPWLAKFSDLWRLINAYEKKHITTQQALHDKYGDYVQLGPNVVSISDPQAVKTIYSTRGTFVKVGVLPLFNAHQLTDQPQTE